MNAHCSHSTAQQIQTALSEETNERVCLEQLWRLHIGVSVILDDLGYHVCLLILLRRAVISCRFHVFMYQSCTGCTRYF